MLFPREFDVLVVGGENRLTGQSRDAAIQAEALGFATYRSKLGGYWLTGDLVYQDEDGTVVLASANLRTAYLKTWGPSWCT